ncbi:MAG TPA: universal stress protein [Acidiferrobacteraceae bacterium]|nr:universal stress protein [Acidiferrobacteraceae bacterium]
MYRTILLCYNGSVDGRRALREGAELATRVGAATHLLAVSRLSPGAAESSALEEPYGALRRGLEETLAEGVARLQARGLHATGHLAFGDPVAEILSCARRIPADLIVVGHRHRSSLARWWSNSVGVGLLEQAPCSILVALLEPQDG